MVFYLNAIRSFYKERTMILESSIFNDFHNMSVRLKKLIMCLPLHLKMQMLNTEICFFLFLGRKKGKCGK